MIKTIVIPRDNNISLSIPNSYIGKEIEVLLFPTDEIADVSILPSKNKASHFKGVLTDEEAEQFHSHLQQARREWDRDI